MVISPGPPVVLTPVAPVTANDDPGPPHALLSLNPPKAGTGLSLGTNLDGHTTSQTRAPDDFFGSLPAGACCAGILSLLDRLVAVPDILQRFTREDWLQ